MKFVLLLTAFVLCLGALYAVWRSQPKISGLPPGHQVHLLGRSYRLCLLFLLSGAIVSLLIGMFSGRMSLSETTMGYLLKTTVMNHDPRTPPIARDYGGDSWMPMAAAIRQLREHPETPVYSEVFFKDKIKFQYPPTALLFLDLPQRIIDCSWLNLFRAVNLICWLCLPAIGLVFFSLFTRAAVSPGIKDDIRLPASSLLILALMSLAAVGSFYSIMRAYCLGQIQTPMTLFAGLALVAWQRQQFGLAGFLIGLCCGIKPQWLAIIPWAILRRQWRMLTALTITVGVLFALSIAAYGISNYADYLSVLSFLGQHGESYFENQSVNGLVNRLFFNGDNLHWSYSAFPPFNPLVYVFTVGSSLLIVGVAMFWRMVKTPSSFDFALILLSLTIASPIAWEHHYGILLLIFAIVLPAAISQRPFGAWTTAYLWLAFLLTSQTFEEVTSHLADTRWNVLQSYLFFGALMVVLLLYRISYLQQSVRYEAARPLGQAAVT